MLLLYKLILFYYTFSLSTVTANICDVSKSDLDETYNTCVNLIDNFNSCWEGPYNVICKGTIATRAVRKCLDNLQEDGLQKCHIERIYQFLTRLGSMMRSTDDILCDLMLNTRFNIQCWERARYATLLQAKFMMDGFDTSEGCGYRIIYSLINEYYSNDYEQCVTLMDSFRRKWYELSPCVRYKDISYLHLSKKGNQIESMCLQIQSDVDDCFRRLLNCDKEQLNSWQCFNDVLDTLQLCNDSLLQLNIRHRAETMKSALEFVCTIKCPELIKVECFSHFEKLTLYSAAAVKEFHSNEFCEFRKQYMDVIVLTSPPYCHKVLEEYSNYMFDVASCVNISETEMHHKLHDYQFDFDKSAQSLPIVTMYIICIIIFQIVNAFF